MSGQNQRTTTFGLALYVLMSFFAVSYAVAAEIDPFYFNAVEIGQDEEWQKLIKYKLWGTGFDTVIDSKRVVQGIVFNNQDIHISDSLGYTGSATGDFILRNDKHDIGGPLAFGGGFSNNTGVDSIFTGPAHFGGVISIESNAYNNNNVLWYGLVCSNSGFERFDNVLKKSNELDVDHPERSLTVVEDCSHPDIPVIDDHLDVPEVDWDYAGFDTTISGNWLFNGSTNVAGRPVSYIDVPSSTKEFYDVLVEGDFIVDDGCDTIYVNNPSNRYVRIFIKGSMNIAGAMHNIVVLDQSGVVSNANYAGNLLFYSPNDINFPAQECVYQGTYISGGTIKFMQHYHFAGQLLAKRVSIDAHFLAGDFRYVPFRPPVIKMDVGSKAYEDHEVEGDNVKLVLSKDPPTRVTFDYCFSLKSANTCNGLTDGDGDCGWANVNDVLASTLNSIPLCGRDTAHNEFPQNSRTLKNPIIFHAYDDPYWEDDEIVYVKIFNLTAAITPNGNREADASYAMKYIIVDNDKQPVSKDTTIICKMNEVLPITSFPAYDPEGINPLNKYNVVIKSIPAEGSLTYNGSPVAVDDVIKALPDDVDPTTGSIKGLVFEPATDKFGTPYATIKFDLCKADAPDICDNAEGNHRTMTINVVNTRFTIKEDAPIDTIVGIIEDMRIPDTLTCSIDAQFIDADTTFRLDSTRIILDKGLNYETQPSYSFVVKCSNGTDIDSTVVSIIVEDVNESPVIRDTVFHVLENQPIGTVVDKLPIIDEDKNQEFRKNRLSIIGGDSDKYSIHDSAGVITTKVVLDYEADAFDTLFVQVRDSDDNLCTARVVILVDNINEESHIRITEAETQDTVWTFPRDTLYINRTEIKLSWKADDIQQPDTLVTDLHEGFNTITLSYYDKTKDRGTIKTIVIFVGTRTPQVSVSVEMPPAAPSNIYTIIEQVPASDTTYYVNKKDNVLKVHVREPIFDETYTDSTCNYTEEKMSISAVLDTLSVSESVFSKMSKIAKNKIALDLAPSTPVEMANANDSLVLVRYTTNVEGEEVTISYYTDSNGDVVKNADGTEVMTVSFETTDSKGQKITVSYQADALTGSLIKQWNDGSYIVTYPYTDKNGKTVDISYFVNSKGKIAKNDEGNIGFEVAYEYTNKKFGNTNRQSVFIVLDTIKPVVKIVNPEAGSTVTTNFVNIDWTVNGDEQDTLNMQGLEKGPNVVVRIYRDKAGNEASDTTDVMLKKQKDLDISVEKPVTTMTQKRVNDYYSKANAPEKDQTFAVSIYNNAKGSDEEVLVGGNMETKAGSGEAPYPGKDDHLGPTLTIDVKMPMASAIGGLATFDDIVSSDGLINMDGIDAQGGKKLEISQYLAEHCTEEFQQSFGGDFSRINMYYATISVHVWIFTNLGNFVDDYTFEAELNDPDYVNKGGMLSLAFELKPDLNGEVFTKSGRQMGTGAYLYKTEVTMKTSLRCSLPPITGEPTDNLKGDIRKVSDEMLRPFGFKRMPKK